MKNKIIFYNILFLIIYFFNINLLGNELKLSLQKELGIGNLKSDFLQYLKDTFKINIFFETGTYAGETTDKASQIFYKVYTTELFEPLYNAALKRFRDKKNVICIKGHSGEIIDRILPTLKNEKIIFWLDAHYSGHGTGKGSGETAEDITPIRKEIDSILKHSQLLEDFVILIDDIRGFGSRINSTTHLGCWAYPTLQEICENILSVNKNFKFAVIGDILLCYDSYKHKPLFSEMIHAITKNRLYDGKNLNDEDLLLTEKIIMESKNEEQSFLERLYLMMGADCDYKEFHYLLWFALSSFSNKKYDLSLKLFEKIINENGYDHWRIFWYAARSAFCANKIEKAMTLAEKISENQINIKYKEKLFNMIKKNKGNNE